MGFTVFDAILVLGYDINGYTGVCMNSQRLAAQQWYEHGRHKPNVVPYAAKSPIYGDVLSPAQVCVHLHDARAQCNRSILRERSSCQVIPCEHRFSERRFFAVVYRCTPQVRF